LGDDEQALAVGAFFNDDAGTCAKRFFVFVFRKEFFNATNRSTCSLMSSALNVLLASIKTA
jgi:hypothetical protein